MILEDLPMTLHRRSFVRRTALAGLSAGGALGKPGGTRAEASPVERPGRGLVWCEGTAGPSVYPRAIDGPLAEFLGRTPLLSVRRGRLDDPDAGLGDEALDTADVLIWWGRRRHDDVPAGRTAAVVERVKAGRLGFVALHG